MIEDSATCIDKQTSIVTASMKRTKQTNLGSNLKPFKKSKAGIAFDDPNLSNGDQSEEESNPTGGQTFDKAENLHSEKKRRRRREKSVERPMITSSRKKGRSSVDSRGLETLLKAVGDLTPATTSNIVKERHATKSFPIPVIMGLQCHAVTVSQSKKLTSTGPKNVVEPEAFQSGVRLALEATSNQERMENDSDTITTKKRGRAFKRQSESENGKTSAAVNNQNGDASVKKVPYRSRRDLTSQQKKYNKPVKAKQVKRRMISLNITDPPQDVQDSTIQQENENSENNVEKSVDTMSDDQPLSRWFVGKSLDPLESKGKNLPESSNPLPAVTNGDGQTLTFEKRSSLWETIESMEAFRLIPQKPHFRPLDNIKEGARERHAINKMVDFSGVFEETRRLKIDHPRTEIDDQLETLLELEPHGFEISFIRNRLMELLALKDKLEGLKSQSKEVKDNLDNRRVEAQKLDKEAESIDKKVSDLLKKRDCVLKEKQKKDSEIVGMEAEIDIMEEGMRECCCMFDDLATSSFVR